MTSSTTSTTRRRLGALLLAACYGGAGVAAPTLPQVAAGQATFAQQGNVYSITNTPGTIINWQSFNVGAGEITRFIQQNADSAVLNRVLGQDPTKILGALQSNGKVFLINPNGILFGQGARVDVNGLVASTLNLGDADFLAGRTTFRAGDKATGTVRNEGTIATPAGGQVFLVAPNVENAGIIAAPGGDVILAAGHRVQLVDAGDPDLRVDLSAPAGQAVNLGRVIAQGGRIGIYGALVNQRGLVSADSAVMGANGRVVLKASGVATLGAGSVTSARGSAGADGGTVRVLGEQVDVAAGAAVDAGGRNGGTVLVGGDWQGRGDVMRARRTTVAAGAVIRADGAAGNGGKVVLWSDGTTVAHGTVSARGSAGGGAVETSGHVLDVDGIAVDAAGGNGKRGTWLLDPYDVEVVAGGTAGAGDVAPGAGGGEGVTRVAPSTLTAAGTDVVLQAQHDLTVSDALNAAGSVRAQAGNDIRVDALVGAGGEIGFRAGNKFTLGAGGTLRTSNAIGITANQVTLSGNVAGNGEGNGQLPVLALTSADAGRAIRIAARPNDGAGDDGALMLDAASLQRLSPNLAGIKVGNATHTGAVTVDGSLSAASDVTLENAGAIRVAAPVDLSAHAGTRFTARQTANGGLIDVADTVKASKSVLLQGDRLALGATVSADSVTLMPTSAETQMTIGGDGRSDAFALGQADFGKVRANELTIGGLARSTGGIDVAGAVELTGSGAPAKFVLDAGAGELAIYAPLRASGTVALASTNGIYESSDGAVSAGALAVRGGMVALSGGNSVGTLAATVGGNLFHVSTRDDLRIGTVDGLTGIVAPNASMQFVSGGALTLDADVAGGGIAIVDAAGIAGRGLLQAGTLLLTSSGGIGTTTSALNTRANMLLATNRGAGDRPINIANSGPLVLARAVQEGEGNAGAISIDSVGGMTLLAYQTYDNEDAFNSVGEVRTNSGDISLTTHSPFLVQGRVTTNSGNVRLLADNGGALTIEAGARVASASGSVVIRGGSVQIAPDTVSVASADRLQVVETGTSGGTTNPPPPPTLDACLANRTTPGCGPVLAAAVQACVADASGPRCAEVLPTLTQCQRNSGMPGCEAVLPTLAQCVASPGLQGCDVRLPSLAACAAAPGTAGCEAVLPTPSFCSAHPGDAACVMVGGSGGGGKDTQGTPVARAVQTAVQAINTAGTEAASPGAPRVAAIVAGDDGKDKDGQGGGAAERAAGPAQADNTGVKNEKPATKLYCN